MDSLFGVSMTTIMVVLVVILVISLLSVGYVALRNPIMFKMGVRNIPRRRAQTTLIVLGLMLSTVIISAAFATGDTVDRSITSEIYSLLGSVDEVVQMQVSDNDAFGDDPGGVVQRDQTFSEESVQQLIEQIGQSQDVETVIPAYSDVAAAVNLDKRLSAPIFNLLGVDPASADVLPDIREESSGRHVNVADLGANEIYIDKSAAEELDVQAGDTIFLYAGQQPHELTVKAIVEDNRLGGAAGISVAREGGVMPLVAVQEIFGQSGRLNRIIVSNDGDARGGYAYVKQVEDWINHALTETQPAPTPGQARLAVSTVKETGVDIAEQSANIFTTFFLVLGLFSIGAGVLLIFMIFVMLAAERKSEMGMARAVGIKRLDLVQTFLSEGMAYNLLAAAVGTALGVVVAFIISKIMASIFASFDLDISAHVTARSVIISYSLGVVLTFLTVTVSSWRVSQINIVRAIRDIPDPPTPKPQWAAGSFWRTLRGLIFKPTDKAGWRRRGVMTLALVLLGVGTAAPPVSILGVLLIVGVLTSFAVSQVGMPVLFKAGVAVAAILFMPVSLIAAVFMTFQLGPLLILASIPSLLFGASQQNAFLVLFGLSMLPLGIGLVIRSFGANERLVYSAVGVLLIYIWEIDFSVGLVEAVFGELNGDIEMFFLSGLMVTLAATFLVVYNADLILGPITRLGRGLGALLPSIKMAVAYPLANKTRTGMTMAMFCLVVFALTVMSSMNYNFNRLFLSDRALGGYDVVVDENPTNPIGDLKGALENAGSPVVSQIDVVAPVSLIGYNRGRVCEPSGDGADCGPADPDSLADYPVRGDSQEFLENSQIGLQARARGYDSDALVWQALAGDPTLAVVDSFSLSGDFGSAPALEQIAADASSFEPLTVRVIDAASGRTADVTVIGVIEMGASSPYAGLHISRSTFDQVYESPDARRFYLRTIDGADNREVAREIESTLLTTGAQAESLRYQLDQQNATFSGFFYLMQGFMGLGLFVGVAAVGVIAFRTVVERRQQIGMLRALGYTRNMVGLTFLLESAFIAFMGVLSGIVFALILARQLITDEFANQGVSSFAVPWEQVLVIGGLAFGFALLMTLIPSRQAASIPIAQALRYE